MNHQYLIPANSKKNQLFLGLFKPIDLLIFLSGVGLSILLLLFINATTSFSMIVKLTPILVGTLAVVPVANYHNVRTFFEEMFKYCFGQKKYYWKGWCVRDEYSEGK